MGIDVHALNLLRFAAARKPFGRVATIGRQGLHVPPEKVRKLLNLNQEIDYGKYCEDLLKAQFGAKSVDSFDNSDYEGATHIVDTKSSHNIQNYQPQLVVKWVRYVVQRVRQNQN